MNLDWITEPISDDAPCGPDLGTGEDAEYEEFYFGALGRLPGEYVRPGVQRPDGSRTQDIIFDPKSVNLNRETKVITAMLRRSRDIRLLVLMAQWCVLAGRIPPLASAVGAIADLLEKFADDVHPTFALGPKDRREALNDLDRQVTVILPMQYAGLTGTTEVTLRKLKVATGRANPMMDEDNLSAAMMQGALAEPANRKKVDETHEALLILLDAMSRIEKACQSHPTHPFLPSLDKLKAVVTETRAAITDARPDLRGTEIETAASSDTSLGTAPSDPSIAPSSTAAVLEAGAYSGEDLIDILNQTQARLTLEACELYFRQSEPSSAALLLITQARLLIGKPLIEALETLLPQQADKAVVDFGLQTGFSMNIDRLRALTSDMPTTATQADPPPEVADPPKVVSPAQATTAIRSVEDYFHRTEKSSPVPLLLRRARTYVGKDFQALVEELIPREQSE